MLVLLCKGKAPQATLPAGLRTSHCAARKSTEWHGIQGRVAWEAANCSPPPPRHVRETRARERTRPQELVWNRLRIFEGRFWYFCRALGPPCKNPGFLPGKPARPAKIPKMPFKNPGFLKVNCRLRPAKIPVLRPAKIPGEPFNEHTVESEYPQQSGAVASVLGS